jgi:hypothetical protein
MPRNMAQQYLLFAICLLLTLPRIVFLIIRIGLQACMLSFLHTKLVLGIPSIDRTRLQPIIEGTARQMAMLFHTEGV